VIPEQELIWIGSSIAGLILAAVGIEDARRDLVALREIPRNGRWMVARHQLIRYALRVLICLCFIGAALVNSMVAAIWLLILANVGLALTTLSDLLTAAFLRRQVRRMETERET
jgi:hypothetical protein